MNSAVTVQEAIYRMAVEGKDRVDAATRSVDGLAVSEEKLTRATRATEQGFDRLMGRLDPAVRAYQQYQRTVEQVQRFEAAGVGSPEQRARAIQLATTQYQSAIPVINNLKSANDNFSKSTGLATYHVTNLGFQINDIASGLAMGQSPFTIMAQQAGQVYQILAMSEKGIGGALRGIGQWLLSLLTPARALFLGLTAATAAAYGLYRVFQTEGPTVSEALEEQARLLGVVQKAYGDAAKAAGTFLDQSKAIVTLQTQQNLLSLQQQLSRMSRSTVSGMTRPTSVPSEIPLDQFDNVIVNASVGASEFAALNHEIEKFNQRAQGAAEVQAFRDAVADIGVAAAATNPSLAKAANEIIASTKALGDLALATLKAEAALRVLQGTATKADLELLNIATKATVNAYDQLIQRTRDRIAEMKLEVLTTGQVEGAVLKMRLQHEAERAAKQAGVSVNQKVLDQLKEELALQTQLRTQARLRSDIGFERSTMFLSTTDQQIAQRLRPLYGDDVNKALASTEAQMMRVNAQLATGKDLAVEFFGGIARDIRNGVSAIDALNNAVTRLADKLMQMVLENLVAKAFGGLLGSGLFGSPSAAMGSGTGFGTTLVGVAHTGGIIGGGAMAGRYVHPAYFENPQYLHGGGIAGLRSNERATVLEVGEEVLTRRDPRHRMNGGGGGLTINTSVSVNVNGGSNEEIAARAGELTRQEVRRQLDQFSRKELPDRVASINADPLARY